MCAAAETLTGAGAPGAGYRAAVADAARLQYFERIGDSAYVSRLHLLICSSFYCLAFTSACMQFQKLRCNQASP